MNLIPNWRSAWRFYSTQLMAIAAAIPIAWDLLPPDLKAYIPDAYMPYIVAGVLLGAIFGRVIDQGHTMIPEEKEPSEYEG